jgi:hypothetical protein
VRKLLLLASFVFVLALTVWRVHSIQKTISSLVPVAEAQGAQCGLIGNNTAYPFEASGTLAELNEAAFTLALYSGTGSEPSVIKKVQESSTTVIIRLGSAVENSRPAEAEYWANFLIRVAQETGKSFVATAGHNEANCAEFFPLDQERTFVTKVAQIIQASEYAEQITLITGQIDHYCGTNQGGTAAEYLAATTIGTDGNPIPGIEGVALPFYITEGTPDATSTVNYFNTFAANTNLPIYVTESGPFLTDSFEEFARAVPQVLATNGRIKAFLLFNAFGHNQSSSLDYTKPFWNPACREAFRTQCNDPDTVIEICGQDTAKLPYYLKPLGGFSPTLGAEPDRAIVLFKNMVEDGYEVRCTTPRFSMAAKVDGALEDFQALFAPGAKVFDINSGQVIDASAMQIPLWRDGASAGAGGQGAAATTDTDTNSTNPTAGGDRGVFGSIEKNFGYRDPLVGTGSGNLQKLHTTSGPVYSLLSLEQQCTQQIESLKQRRYLCDLYVNPDACALKEAIPNTTDFDTMTLLNAFEGSGLTCAQIAQENLTPEQEKIAKALAYVPLYLEKSYRLGFLVAVTEMKPDERAGGIFFNFFAADNDGKDQTKKHKVAVIPFKFPDGAGTNREKIEGINYQDPLQITRDALTSQADIVKRQEEYAENIHRYLNTPFQGKRPRVLCGGENCTDPLTKAVTDMINGSEDKKVEGSCIVEAENLEGETSQIVSSADLGAAGGVTESPADANKDKTTDTTANNSILNLVKPGYELIKNLIVRPPNQATQPQRAEFNFLSFLDPGIKEQAGGTDTVFYTILPMGYELEKAEETLAGFIFDEAALNLYQENDEVHDYFETQGFSFTFNSDKETYPFANPSSPTYQACIAANPTTPEACAQKITVGVESKNNDPAYAPRVLGGKLGSLVRKMQENILAFNTAAHKFVASCKTLDEYLRGNCSGEVPASTTPPSSASNLEPVAQCQAGSARITSGEDAQHVYTDASQSCARFVPATHDVPRWKDPNDPVRPCDQLFSYVACTYPNTLIQNPVNANGQFDTSGQITACQYVVDSAKAAGISPRLALAMWGEESGFSHYRVPDFGVVSQPAQDLGAQVTTFLNTIRGKSTYLSFLLQYSGETTTDFCNNKFFPARLKVFYNYLGP